MRVIYSYIHTGARASSFRVNLFKGHTALAKRVLRVALFEIGRACLWHLCPVKYDVFVERFNLPWNTLSRTLKLPAASSVEGERQK
jgi:hypothetical protein